MDYAQRVEEMRADWETSMSELIAEKEAADDVYDDGCSSEVSTFFERTRGKNGSAEMSPFKQQQLGNTGVGNGAPGELKEKDEEHNGIH